MNNILAIIDGQRSGESFDNGTMEMVTVSSAVQLESQTDVWQSRPSRLLSVKHYVSFVKDV